MKKFILLALFIFLVLFLTFRIAYFLGKQTALMESRSTLNAQVYNAPQADYYNQVVLKNCLSKLKELQK